jgi:hypothetical protein
MLYDAITSSNRRSTLASNLLGGEAKQVHGLKSMAELGDGRLMSGGLQLAISAKKIVCTSFDSQWKCLRCAQHLHEEAFKIRGVANSACPRQVVIVADQSFPACLPTSGQMDCIKILLVENCSLQEAAAEFIKKLGNRRVPPGSVILLLSATHLANVGLAQYTEDLLEASSKIKASVGKETICLPLPPLIMGGTDNVELVRSIFELMAWTESYYIDHNNNTEETNNMVLDLLNEMADGEFATASSRRLTLPVNPSGKRVWESGGNSSKALPCFLKPATQPQETRFVAKLIAELREKFGLNLDPQPSHDRKLGPQPKPRRKGDLLLVGSSNASKMSALLTEKGKSTGLLFSPGWTISRREVDEMAAMINRRVNEEDPAIVILQILDNSVFYVKTEDGSRHLPRKDADGRIHVDGEIRVCSGEVQEDHFRALKPIFDAIGKKKCIVISPMPRYVSSGCCNNSGHVANRSDPYYLEDMRVQLDGLRRHLREFLFTSGRRNFKVYDPNVDLKDFTVEQTWGDDPIHPKREVASKMADSIISLVDSMEDDGRQEDSRSSGGQDAGHTNQRNRWPGPRRGGGGYHPYNSYNSYNNQNSNMDNVGRHTPTGHPRGGRSGRGGQYRGRAGPY